MMEYHLKEQWMKPHKKTNVYIALFTTAHARLILFDVLDTLKEKVMYLDTDSCIYIDDKSQECKKIETMLGKNLGELTDETFPYHIIEFVSPGPKDYSYKLNNHKVTGKFKGIMTNISSDQITMSKKINLVKNNEEPYVLVEYSKINTNKEHTLQTKQEIKMYDFEFNKRIPVYLENGNVISHPFGTC